MQNLRSDYFQRRISSRVGQKHRDIALALGVNHYLGKPYSEEALLALVRTYFREKALT
jgi:chemosensory pili system protein ChpA (sensor histidine kinase/response regulator)